MTQVQVICSFVRVKFVRVERSRTSTNACSSVAIINLVKIVENLECLAKVYSNIAHNVIIYVVVDVIILCCINK